MKLIKIVLLLVGLYSAICGNTAIDQLAEGFKKIHDECQSIIDLLQTLDVNNPIEKELKKILNSTQGSSLLPSLAQHVSIFNAVKSSPLAMKYITQSDTNAQQTSLEKLKKIINRTDLSDSEKIQLISENPDQLTTKQNAFALLFDESSSSEQNLYKVLSNPQDDLGKMLIQIAKINNLINIINLLKSDAIVINTVATNKKLRSDLAQQIEYNDRFFSNLSNTTFGKKIDEIIKNAPKYDSTKKFALAHNLNPLLTILSDSNFKDELDNLEESLAVKNHYDHLNSLWTTTMNDPKFNKFKEDFSNDPLFLNTLTLYCKTNCMNEIQSLSQNEIQNLIESRQGFSNVFCQETDDNKLVNIIKDYKEGW